MSGNWAVDLKDIGAVYPWVGLETIMVLAAIIAWLLWHYLQIRAEEREYAEDIKLFGGKEGVKRALDEQV